MMTATAPLAALVERLRKQTYALRDDSETLLAIVDEQQRSLVPLAEALDEVGSEIEDASDTDSAWERVAAAARQAREAIARVQVLAAGAGESK